MTTQQNKQDMSELQLIKLQEENDLLLVQIHQLQEELEHYFLRNQELEKGQSVSSGSEVSGINWVDDELPDALAENQRLHALVELLRNVHQLESKNALNVKLGNILIQSVDSPGKLMAVPAKVGRVWRESSRKNPPKSLGGKGFEKLIAAYSNGEFKAVEKLLSAVSLAPTIQASGYTVLARQLMSNDLAATAEAARRAYEIEPQPFRLKWLAFRLHEAGDVIEAEAMLDILPNDIKFSESEARQASQVRNEAKHVRQHEAKQKTRFSERRAEVERKFEQLTQFKVSTEEENELLLLQLHQAQEELEQQYLKCQTLEHTQKQLEQEKKDLAGKRDEQAKLLVDSQEENELLLLQLHQVQEELEQQYLKCQTFEHAQVQMEQEKKAITGKTDEQANLLAASQARIEQLTQEKAVVEYEHDREVEALKQAQSQNKEEEEVFLQQVFQELEDQYLKYETLDQKKKLLVDEKDKQDKFATERQAEIKQLTQAKVAMESEQAKLLADSQARIEQFKQVHVQLEKEKLALAGEKDEQAKALADRQVQIEQLMKAKAAVEAERGREVDALKQAKTQLEKEKLALAGEKDEQAKELADRQVQIEQLMKAKAAVEAERGREVETLKQTKAQLEKEKLALTGEKDEQAKASADRQVQIEQLMKAKAAVEAERGREVETLKQTKAQLEKEKLALTSKQDEHAKLLADRQTQIEQLAQEKNALVCQKDEQTKLAADRLIKIENIQQTVQAREISEAELTERQHAMHEEIVRAEAQLDLIKDVLLREQGL